MFYTVSRARGSLLGRCRGFGLVPSAQLIRDGETSSIQMFAGVPSCHRSLFTKVGHTQEQILTPFFPIKRYWPSCCHQYPSPANPQNAPTVELQVQTLSTLSLRLLLVCVDVKHCYWSDVEGVNGLCWWIRCVCLCCSYHSRSPGLGLTRILPLEVGSAHNYPSGSSSVTAFPW